MAETKTYTGGCHCGAVRYEATADLQQVISCNCSICQKKGPLLAFVPASAFTLKSGQDNLQDYQFYKHVIHHLFCRTCGVESFARGTGPDGTEMVGLNVRCFDAIDLGAFTPVPFNGRDL
jgi:hypothetical protein